jgi:hypothetical protein
VPNVGKGISKENYKIHVLLHSVKRRKYYFIAFHEIQALVWCTPSAWCPYSWL